MSLILILEASKAILCIKRYTDIAEAKESTKTRPLLLQHYSQKLSNVKHPIRYMNPKGITIDKMYFMYFMVCD